MDGMKINCSFPSLFGQHPNSDCLLGHLWLILNCLREVIQLTEESELLEILERVMDPNLSCFSGLFFTMFKGRQVYLRFQLLAHLGFMTCL